VASEEASVVVSMGVKEKWPELAAPEEALGEEEQQVLVAPLLSLAVLGAGQVEGQYHSAISHRTGKYCQSSHHRPVLLAD